MFRSSGSSLLATVNLMSFLMLQVMGISSSQTVPAAPSNIAPSTTYDSNLPTFPTAYSSTEKIAQARAGTVLIQSLYTFCQKHLVMPADNSTAVFTVAPGVYRLHSHIVIPSVVNVKLVMSNVELLSITGDGHFTMFGPNNLEIAGPLILDSDPPSTSQNVIVGTDFYSYVDVRPMQGFHEPNVNARVMMYTPDGTMQRHYQDAVVSVTPRGNNIYRLNIAHLGQNNPAEARLTRKAFKVGNFLSTEGNQTTTSGGINLQAVGNLYMHDIYYYSSSLVFCQNTAGTLRLDKYVGRRRPGTNRLGAGGWLQCQFNGGSLDMTNSEISFNYDDLTDISGYLGEALIGPQTDQVYLTADHLDIGRVFRFYDAKTLEVSGEASITAIIDRNPSASVRQQIAAHAAAASALYYGYDENYILVNLSSSLRNQSGFYIADDLASKPQLLSIRDSYFHDGLAAAIQLRAAHQVVATGNVVERVSLSCLIGSFQAYFHEGGIASNIDFRNNYCLDTPYAVGASGAAIFIGTDNAQTRAANNTDVFENVTVVDNIVINPQLAAIQIDDSANVLLSGNQIYNPGWQATIRDSNRPPYVISLQTSRNVTVLNNTAYNTNGGIGYGGPVYSQNFIVANSRSDNSTFHLDSNVFDGQTAPTVAANLDTTNY